MLALGSSLARLHNEKGRPVCAIAGEYGAGAVGATLFGCVSTLWGCVLALPVTRFEPAHLLRRQRDVERREAVREFEQAARTD